MPYPEVPLEYDCKAPSHKHDYVGIELTFSHLIHSSGGRSDGFPSATGSGKRIYFSGSQMNGGNARDTGVVNLSWTYDGNPSTPKPKCVGVRWYCQKGHWKKGQY